jgi:hypothetical protein
LDYFLTIKIGFLFDDPAGTKIYLPIKKKNQTGATDDESYPH